MTAKAKTLQEDFAHSIGGIKIWSEDASRIDGIGPDNEGPPAAWLYRDPPKNKRGLNIAFGVDGTPVTVVIPERVLWEIHDKMNLGLPK